MRGSSVVRRNRVMIFEPHGHGHHGPYLQWMATGLAERGMKVTVVTLPDAMEHPSMRALSAAGQIVGNGTLRLVASPSKGFSLGRDDSSGRLAAREWAYWNLFRRWYQLHAGDVRPDLIFLPYLDYCLYAIGLLGSPFGEVAWSGLAMRPSFHYKQIGVIAPKPRFSGMKQALFFRMLKNKYMSRLLTVNEPLAQYLVDRGMGKTVFFPEPADFVDLPETSNARHQLGLSPDRRIILVYGAISRRKGIVELLEAVADPTFSPIVDVILAGRISSEIGEALDQPVNRALVSQGRLKVFDRFIEEQEESLLFAAADIVWIGYHGHYNSSGILVQAAKARRPVVACRDGIIGWQTERYNLGRTVDPRHKVSVIAAVSSLLEAPIESKDSMEPTTLWEPPSIAEAQNILADSLLL